MKPTSAAALAAFVCACSSTPSASPDVPSLGDAGAPTDAGAPPPDAPAQDDAAITQARESYDRGAAAYDAKDYAKRAAMYRAIVRYETDLSRRHGDPTEPPWVQVLHATDSKLFYVPRGLFGTFAKRTIRGVTPGTFNAQMRRLGWVDRDLQPRKPKPPDADATFEEVKRPKLRLWAIPDGWEGIDADGVADRGDAETRGDAFTDARVGARASLHPGVSTSPRVHGRRPT